MLVCNISADRLINHDTCNCNLRWLHDVVDCQLPSFLPTRSPQAQQMQSPKVYEGWRLLHCLQQEVCRWESHLYSRCYYCRLTPWLSLSVVCCCAVVMDFLWRRLKIEDWRLKIVRRAAMLDLIGGDRQTDTIVKTLVSIFITSVILLCSL